MNDAALSPSWPSRQASYVVEREGYDTAQGLNPRTL